ncbi:hypothetical protein FB451DRAFT_1197847 [Mycena latifolia]|nr:hypothetical protein FB451DRAFT_1197847 [Mycena latifolia]
MQRSTPEGSKKSEPKIRHRSQGFTKDVDQHPRSSSVTKAGESIGRVPRDTRVSECREELPAGGKPSENQAGLGNVIEFLVGLVQELHFGHGTPNVGSVGGKVVSAARYGAAARKSSLSAESDAATYADVAEADGEEQEAEGTEEDVEAEERAAGAGEEEEGAEERAERSEQQGEVARHEECGAREREEQWRQARAPGRREGREEAGRKRRRMGRTRCSCAIASPGASSGVIVRELVEQHDPVGRHRICERAHGVGQWEGCSRYIGKRAWDPLASAGRDKTLDCNCTHRALPTALGPEMRNPRPG